MKKSILLLSFSISLSSNVFASSKANIYQQKFPPEVDIQIKKLSEQVQNLTQVLKNDEEKRTAFLERLSKQQLKLINGIEDEYDKEKVVQLIQNFGTPTGTVATATLANHCITNPPENRICNKIFQILTNVTSPTAFFSTASIIITLAVKGMVTSGELTLIFQQLATIAKWMTIRDLSSWLWYCIPFVGKAVG